MKARTKVTLSSFIFLLLLLFLFNAQQGMRFFFDGVTVWALNVLPALFPFSVLSALSLQLAPRLKKKFSLTKALFKSTDADGMFLISLLCGYPLGAKVVAEGVSEGRLTACQATKISTFCSTASPVFIIGTIGAKLLGNGKAALIILAAHWLSALLNGLVFRNAFVDFSAAQSVESKPLSPSLLSETITSSALSVITLGGMIALFYMLCKLAELLLPQWLVGNVAFGYAMGLLEMTSGIIKICSTVDLFSATVLTCSLLSFGGFCVFFQCFSFLSKGNVKAKNILLFKFTQGGIATVICYLLAKLFL